MVPIKEIGPRLKIIFTAVLIIIALLISRILTMVFLIGVTLAIALKGKLLSKLLSYLSPLKILVPILFVINMIFYASGNVYTSLNLRIVELAITSGGIYRSSLICFRLTAIASAAALLAVTVSPREFEYGIKRLGFPWKLAFIFSLTMKIVPEMKKKFKEIEEAQYSRGLERGGNLIEKAKKKIPIIIPFLASVSRHGYELSQVLRARNFGTERTHFKEKNYKNI